MIIQLDDEESRLLYNVLIAQAQEHLSYAGTSEVAMRLFKLAIRFKRRDGDFNAPCLRAEDSNILVASSSKA